MSNEQTVIYGLKSPTAGYTHFEKDQVLTHDQLNDMAGYLDSQIRLNRVELLSVGIISGLKARLQGANIIVTKGLGVPTDGDLIFLKADTTFQYYKEYGNNAPLYLPFYPEADSNGHGQMLQAYELVSDADKDDASQELTALADKLSDMVVVAYMESYCDDPDLCSGTDCDNLGQTIRNTARFLLLPSHDAAKLIYSLEAVRMLARKLPAISADRPAFQGASITSTGALVAPFRTSCDKILTKLKAALPALAENFPQLLNDALFGAAPSEDWLKTLDKQAFDAFQNGNKPSDQFVCFYDYLKDLVDTWNELREVLLSDNSALSQDASDFPKHLLLGRLSNPTELRTGLYPSPLIGSGSQHMEHASFLIRKLHLLINTHLLPTDKYLIVTPSHNEYVPLEERAIPYYYANKTDFPALNQGWNYRLSMRGEDQSNNWYRSESPHNSSQLGMQIGRYDFFRIEGFLGERIEGIKANLDQLIVEYNLPFAVRAVLVHTSREKLVIKPAWRYTDLHRVHYLVRNDVASHLLDTMRFGAQLKKNIKAKVRDAYIPLNTSPNSLEDNVTTQAAHTVTLLAKAVTSAMGKDQKSGPLNSRTYGQYKSLTPSPEWQTKFAEARAATLQIKSSLGDYMRNDAHSPFDSIAAHKHNHWIDWIDQMIQHHDDREDDKLLLSNFMKYHHSLEHLGGVPRGGTLVLVYDDSGKIVVDLALPYWCDAPEEKEANEPDEPKLTLPPAVLPATIMPVKVVKPMDTVIAQFANDKLKTDLVNKVDMKSYFSVLDSSISAIRQAYQGGAVVQPGKTPAATGNAGLDAITEGIQNKQDEIAHWAEARAVPDLTDSERDLFDSKLKAAQSSLATLVQDATKVILTSNVNIASGTPASAAAATITRSVSSITDVAIAGSLSGSLSEMQSSAVGLQQTMIQNMTANLVRG